MGRVIEALEESLVVESYCLRCLRRYLESSADIYGLDRTDGIEH